MTFFRRLLCRDSSAVVESGGGGDDAARFGTTPPSAGSGPHYQSPSKSVHWNGAAIGYGEGNGDEFFLSRQDEVLILPPTHTDGTRNELLDTDATETEEESSEDESMSWQENTRGDKNVALLSLASLLGETLVSARSSSGACRVDNSTSTNIALRNSALVAIYYANAPLCQRETKLLAFFDAGYELGSFSVVYVNSSSSFSNHQDEDHADAVNKMPARWWTLPCTTTTDTITTTTESKNEDIRAMLAEKYGLGQEDASRPALIVLDPSTGILLSELSSSVMDDIVALDPCSEEEYDARASEIFQRWIGNLPLEQQVVGTMEIEVRDGTSS
jgi:hypothetical protein